MSATCRYNSTSCGSIRASAGCSGRRTSVPVVKSPKMPLLPSNVHAHLQSRAAAPRTRPHRPRLVCTACIASIIRLSVRAVALLLRLDSASFRISATLQTGTAAPPYEAPSSRSQPEASPVLTHGNAAGRMQPRAAPRRWRRSTGSQAVTGATGNSQYAAAHVCSLTAAR